MLLLKKTDYYLECIILALMFLSLPFMYQFGFLAGLFFLGIVQLVSAALNTRSFLHNGFKKEISRYWWLVIVYLSVFLPVVILNIRNIITILFCIIVVAATTISIYYLIIYKKIIDGIQLRIELSGFTKS